MRVRKTVLSTTGIKLFWLIWHKFINLICQIKYMYLVQILHFDYTYLREVCMADYMYAGITCSNYISKQLPSACKEKLLTRF